MVGRTKYLVLVLILSFILLIFPTWLTISHKSNNEASQRMEASSHESASTSLRSQKKGGQNNTVGGGRQLAQTPTEVVQFETFKLSDAELKLFYGRRHEPKEWTLAISGLKIDKKYFEVSQPERSLPERVRISLPGGGGQKEFVRTSVDLKSNEAFVWSGVVTNNKVETCHLSVFHNVIVGHIETREASYEIKYLSEGKSIIRKVDRKQYPDNSNDVLFPEEPSNSGALQVDPNFSDRYENLKNEYAMSASQGDDEIVIDIILGYSYLIKNSEGGADAAKALINLLVGIAQTAYRNSETRIAFRVSEMVELDVKSDSELGSNLVKLRRAYEVELGDGEYDANDPYHFLARRRYQTGSDLMALVTEQFTSNACGIAYVLYRNSLGYQSTRRESVSAANCLGYVLSHEIGHSLGAMHALDQHSEEDRDYYASKGIYPYAYGFREPGQVRTQMSYNCAIDDNPCPMVSYFSHPGKVVNGVTIGTEDVIDNARAIRQQAPIASLVSETRAMNSTQMSLPHIIRQPQDGHVSDSGFTLDVEAVNLRSPPYETVLSYQWYQGSSLISGATDRELTVRQSDRPGTATQVQYHVRVSNSSGYVQSNIVTLDFRKMPMIVKQPEGGHVSESGYTLRVEANNPNLPPNDGALSYQWYRNGSQISGANGNSIFVSYSSGSEIEATYYVEISLASGQFVVVVGVKSNVVTVDFRKKPVIISHPYAGHIPESGRALEVEAKNPNPHPYDEALSYQWYRDGNEVPGATKSSVLIKPYPGIGIEHSYYVEVFHSVGRVQSNVAVIDFRKKPVILRQPQGGSVTKDGYTLRVGATNPNPAPYDEALSYQWYRGGVLLEGATEPSLRVESAHDIEFEASYYVEVFHSVGRVQSDVVKVEFLTRPRSGQWDILVNHGEPSSPSKLEK